LILVGNNVVMKI